jgi:hypothetical protein
MVSSPENEEAIQSGDEVRSHGPQKVLRDDLLPLSFGGLGLHLGPTKACERLHVAYSSFGTTHTQTYAMDTV